MNEYFAIGVLVTLALLALVYGSKARRKMPGSKGEPGYVPVDDSGIRRTRDFEDPRDASWARALPADDAGKDLAACAFVDLWASVQADVYRTAVEHGWWEGGRNDGEAIALMHSELSEALEAIRKGIESDDHIPCYTGLEAELADVVIRIMDFAGGNDLDIAGAIMAKIEYNKHRPYKHGGKKF